MLDVKDSGEINRARQVSRESLTFPTKRVELLPNREGIMYRRTLLSTSITAGIVGAFFVIRPFQPTVQGQDMRIETEVYSGNARQPVFENITLFSDTSVYDFSRTGPEKITVYDRRTGRFVLLNVASKTKVVLEQKTVDEYVEILKKRELLTKKEPFLFNPKFDETYNEATKQITLSSDQMTYKIKGTPSKSKESFDAYIDFANGYSKLSATDPRQMPPFARLEVNKAISNREIIPQEVERVYKPSNGVFGNAIKAKTKHFVVWTLSRKDRQRIDQALDYVTEFKEVSLPEYYGIAKSQSPTLAR